MKKLVIFDFDGTLVDSVGGLAAAVNHTLREQGFATHSTEEIRGFIGDGILCLLQRALPKSERTTDTLAKSKDIFLDYYDKHNTDFTEIYDNIEELLQQLQDKGVMMAVASNKYHKATVEMAKHFFPNIKFVSILGQRAGIAVKPDPTIVHDTLELAGVTNLAEVLYVGDSGVDIQTAHNAGVEACGVSWGFRSREELEALEAEYIIDSPLELPDIL